MPTSHQRFVDRGCVRRLRAELGLDLALLLPATAHSKQTAY